MKKKLFTGLATGLIMLTATVAAQATPITFAASSGALAASVTFEVSGTNLMVTLTNTSMADVLVPSNVLTAVFFDINGVGALTSVSALLDGSTVYYDPDGQPAGGVVGGEWAYASGLSGAPNGATEGISSSGLDGLFGASTFPGVNLAGPPNGALGGLQYGILSAGDNPLTGNGGITGSGGLINNSVIFTLSSLQLAGFDPSLAGAITNVSFQYGTSLKDPNVPVPEPAAMLLFGTGLIGLAGIARRKRS